MRHAAVLIRPACEGSGLLVPGWNPDLFGSCPISGRDAITVRPWSISWVYDGKTRHVTVPEDWRFGVATDKVSGFWMRVMRTAVNTQHMQRSSCIHDLLMRRPAVAVSSLPARCSQSFYHSKMYRGRKLMPLRMRSQLATELPNGKRTLSIGHSTGACAWNE